MYKEATKVIPDLFKAGSRITPMYREATIESRSVQSINCKNNPYVQGSNNNIQGSNWLRYY